jgi:hypothetical protein
MLQDIGVEGVVGGSCGSCRVFWGGVIVLQRQVKKQKWWRCVTRGDVQSVAATGQGTCNASAVQDDAAALVGPSAGFATATHISVLDS